MDDSLDNGASVKKQSFSAKLAFVGSFNLALQQNAVKAVYELKLKNDLGRDLRNLKCEFSASPELISPKTVTVEELKDGEELALHDLGIELDYRFLAELSEALNGKLKLRIGDGGTVLFDREYDVTAYAPDQWLGLNVMPELIAAFVTPNMEVVSHLMTTVGEELKQATGSSSIQGYQQDKTRVYEICSAIYRAIHSWGIQYAEPPSSFGDPGQRIRFADTVYHYRLGTCLDTTLLFASVMEQCGLHPVIMLTQGHAYIGCHLIDRYFNDLPMDDLQVIRKLVDLDEFLVIETTMVTDGHATFSQAEAAARGEHLNIDDKFYCAIDIVRARYSGIRPLPLSRSVNGIEFQPAERQAEKLGEENKRKLQQEVDLDRLSAEDPRGGRVARWTQKLLDLSLRNRLLNARDNRQIIPIACPDITALEDRIAANEEMALKALPELLSEKDVHDLAMLRNSEVKSDIKKLLDRELSQKRLWSILPPAELGKRLTYLYRQSRTDLEEGGVNTLFLAIGFLEWKVSERDSRSYLAPILLIPVRMSRKSIVEGIRISRIDEDTVINETLLELLRSQFQLTVPGISPLPTDASGVDVGMVMQIFRQTIRDMKGWEVREEAKIGHFSFGKFIMWNDMTNRIGDLKKHPLVRHLIEGGGIFDDGIEVFPPEKIGSHLNLHKLYCPLGADSSQLTAVLYSALGKSFVLHGPPGTGKSQTITNIIAHNLALGRRVLFVSEKKAALDVVHKRLSAVGLKPFCLELHSNKSGKAEVLKQFSDALQVPDTAPPAEWEKNIRALELTRAALGGYVNELHRRFPNGFSAYDCFSRLFPMCGKKLGGPTLPIRCLRQTPEEYEKLCGAVAALASAWEGTSPQACEALRKLDPAAWSPVFEKELRDSAAALAAAIRKLRDALAVTAELLPVKDNLAMDSVYRLAILTELFKHCGDIPENFLDGDFAKHAEFVSGYAANAVCCWELGEKLKNYRLESFPDFDFPGIAERLERNDRSFFPIGFIKNLMLVRELAVLKKTGGVKLSVSELRALLPDAEKYVSARAAVERGKQEAAALLGEVWNGDSTRWDDVGTTLKKTEEILKALRELTSDDDEEYRTLLRKLRTFLPRAEQTFRQEGELRKRINGFLAAWNDLQETLRDFSKYASQLASPPRLDELDTELSGIIANLDELRGVMVFRQQEDEAGKLGAAALPVALRAGQVAPAALTAKFDEMFFRTMLEQILAVSPALCAFNGGSRNGTIRKFCELDKEYTSLTRRIVFAKLAATLPRRRSGPCPEGTELGVLKRECEKRARQKPVRQLLEQIPKLAAILKPCFLMSPLSVAQYLPPDSEPFDLVVFDEASQIPVWDAIGVIARGRQLIVVGDPKQMPPTNFFQKGDADAPEDAPEELEDMESILDECIAAGVYPTYLNWHYRSRHEALISFSNHYYYEDRLFTFPAARDTDKLGVRFEFVGDGVYDRKASRTNRREAKALVDYIFRHLEKSSKPRSIGVVTFSQAQRDLIEDMVEHERTKHPKLEEYFGDGNEDPMFVKNLENVQGDERDVILFSGGLFPTKLNKEMFYADFLHYKLHGQSISGLQYQAIQYGPVPVHYDTIYDNIDGINKEIVVAHDMESTRLSCSSCDTSVFSEQELETLGIVLAKIRPMSTQEVIDRSHLEDAWKHYRDENQIIPYSEAFSIVLV